MNCPNLQKSLAFCDGLPQYPGIRRRIYYIAKSQIVSYPQLPRDTNGVPTSAVLVGDFTLKADVVFKYIDINVDKSQVTSEAQGEVPSQTQLNKATFVHNGIGAEAAEAPIFANNSDNVYIFQDMAGNYRVLGNERWATKSTVAQDNGQGTNPASTTIEVEVTDEIVAPFYKGIIATEDGDIDCSGEAADDEEEEDDDNNN